MSSNGSSAVSSAVSAIHKNDSASSAHQKGQGCSVLCSPLGLLLLEYYCKLAENCVELKDDLARIQTLEEGVASFLHELQREDKWKETDLTGGLCRMLKTKTAGELPSLGLEGECGANGVKVYDWGWDDKADRNGKADIAFFKASPAPPGTGTSTNTSTNTSTGTGTNSENLDAGASRRTKKKKTEPEGVHGTRRLVGILEASVDSNGGLKKVAQGNDYAVMLGVKPDSTDKQFCVVWTLHINRGPKQKGATPTSTSSSTTPNAATAASGTKTATNTAVTEAKTEDPSAAAVGAGIDNGVDNVVDDVTVAGTATCPKTATAPATNNGTDGSSGKGNDAKKEAPGRPMLQNMEVRVYLCEVSWNKDKSCIQSRYALIWRDFAREEDAGNPELINRTSHAIALAVAMVLKLADLLGNIEEKVNRRFPGWTLKGPNCARTGYTTCTTSASSTATATANTDSQSYMYKVFDNRMSPTARSPYMWVDKRLCDPRFDVEPFLLFHEGHFSTDVDIGGIPPSYVYTHSDRKPSNEVDIVKRTIQRLSEDGRGQGGQRRGEEISSNNAGGTSESDNDGCGGGGSSSTSEVDSGGKLVKRQPLPLLGNSRPKLSGSPRRKSDEKPGIPFGKGTIVVLRYKYAEGQYWPSGTMSYLGNPPIDLGTGGSSGANPTQKLIETHGSPRSFLPILRRLKEIHEDRMENGEKRSFVHGDVRLYNMVFGPSSGSSGSSGPKDSPGSKEDLAFLLDYDLGGVEGWRTYPPMYTGHLPDIDVRQRAGKENKPLSFRHDLADFIDVLRFFGLKSMLVHDLSQQEEDLTQRYFDLSRKVRGLTRKVRGLTQKVLELLNDKQTEGKSLSPTNKQQSDSSSCDAEEHKLKQDIASAEAELKKVNGEIEPLNREIERLNDKIEELDFENRVKTLEEHRLIVQRFLPQWKQNLLNFKKELLRNDGNTEISKTDAHRKLESLLKYDEKIKKEFPNRDYDPKLYFEADKGVRFFV